MTLRFTTGTVPTLPAPTGLTAKRDSPARSGCAGRSNAGTETGYEIERCAGTGCTSFVQVATAGRDATEHVDTELARSTQYSYRVRAFNANRR